jgi:hypothetical protein
MFGRQRKGMKRGTAVGAVIASTIALCSGASAQDMRALLDQVPQAYLKRVSDFEKMLLSADSSDQARSVYFKGKLWAPSYKRLKVCFFGGSKELRAKIADVASEWMQADNSIKLDFGKTKNRICKSDSGTEMQIRVSFNKAGWWSAVGQDSVVFFPQNEPSLNLSGFADVAPDALDAWSISTIRHEFGHALGLKHEHQNPRAKCEIEYNWKLIYELLSKPPDNWTKETVDWNMRPISGDDLVASKFDKKSIMLYLFPAQFYKKGAKSRCFVAKMNYQISEGDRAAISEMYPADPNARLANFESNKAAFADLLKKKGEEASRGVSIDPMKAYFERPGSESDGDDE